METKENNSPGQLVVSVMAWPIAIIEWQSQGSKAYQISIRGGRQFEGEEVRWLAVDGLKVRQRRLKVLKLRRPSHLGVFM